MHCHADAITEFEPGAKVRFGPDWSPTKSTTSGGNDFSPESGSGGAGVDEAPALDAEETFMSTTFAEEQRGERAGERAGVDKLDDPDSEFGDGERLFDSALNPVTEERMRRR